MHDVFLKELALISPFMFFQNNLNSFEVPLVLLPPRSRVFVYQIKSKLAEVFSSKNQKEK
jgi:hypothetical protein